MRGLLGLRGLIGIRDILIAGGGGLVIPTPSNYDLMVSGDSFVAGSGGYAPVRGLGEDTDYQHVVNNGRAGESSTQILANMQASYTAYQGRIQLIHWGRNDSSAATIFSNINTWKTACGHENFLIKPLFQPAGSPLAFITDFNNNLTNEFETWQIVTPGIVAGYDPDTLIASHNSGDDEHPSASGYDIIAAADSAALARNGWLRPVTLQTLPASPAAYSLALSGINEYAQITSFGSSGVSLNLDSDTSIARYNGYAITAWVKLTGSGAILRIGRNGPYQAFLYNASNGTLGFFGGGNQVTTVTTLNDNAWHHVVANVYRSGVDLVVDLWIDGVKRLSAGAMGNSLHTSDGITIGARYDTGGVLGSYHPGRLYQLNIRRATLSDSEIATEYNSGTPIALANYPGTIVFCPDIDAAQAANDGNIPDLGPFSATLTGANLGSDDWSTDTP